MRRLFARGYGSEPPDLELEGVLEDVEEARRVHLALAVLEDHGWEPVAFVVSQPPDAGVRVLLAVHYVRAVSLVVDGERHLVDLYHHAARELIHVSVEVVRAGQQVHRFLVVELGHHELEPLRDAIDAQVWQDGLIAELAASLLDV